MENTPRLYRGWTDYKILMKEYEFRYRPLGAKDSSTRKNFMEKEN